MAWREHSLPRADCRSARHRNTLIVPSNLADLGTLVTAATTMFKAQS